MKIYGPTFYVAAVHFFQLSPRQLQAKSYACEYTLVRKYVDVRTIRNDKNDPKLPAKG